ncbi:MAG TPA: COR domain-containing protein, partial [Urbifossiella sp.]|nr:COR domain-containing protein [Urbifossiella sp.]
MTTPEELHPDEREPFEQLQRRFGERFRFDVANKHIIGIDLSSCELTVVPSEIFRLTHVTLLNLSENQLTALPPEIGQLAALSHLWVSENQLTALPPEIGKLTQLFFLGMSENQLTALPPEIGKLRQLTALFVDRNRLTTLPPEIGNLTQVIELRVSENQLTALPPELGNLGRLVVVYVDQNRLTSLPPELGNLTHLTHLYIFGNQLTTLPPELGHLTALKELWADQNRLSALPPELGQLTALTLLSVSKNRLTALPPELGQLTALTQLWMYQNPLPDPYAELFQRGIPALQAYLRSLTDRSRVVSLREARLILIGNGKVGKTQLKNALLGPRFQEQAPTTHGVEIDRQQQLTLPCTAADDLTLTIWDFGGQETYEVTHQFFYGKRSVYLLVWHPRAATPDLGVEAWLRKLKLRLGDEARVIIVATHKNTDQRPADLDLNGLRQKFGDIVLDLYKVENNSRDEATNGIPALKAAIAAAANDLSLMGMKVNRDWLTVRDELTTLAETETHITRQRFDEIAARHGLTEDVAAVWRNLLHDLGVLLYYGDVDGLEDVVVLRPDWLTGAIARVLDDAEVLKNRGVLDHDRLPELWAKYEASLHPFLHAVMEQFDICCRDKKEAWSLVGEKVPHERPTDAPVPTGHQIRLVYKFDDEPPGLMPWLIVRSYRFTANRHWRLGAYLTHDQHGALVEFDRGSRQLSLTVHGANPMYFFALLQDGVEQVLPRWEGLQDKVHRLVPCGQTRKDGTPCDRYFNLADLKDAAANDDPMQCNGCRKMADVGRLLSGVGVRQEPIVEQVAELLDEKLEPLRELFQHSQRTMLRAIGGTSKDAPRLFSMWPKTVGDKSWWERLDPRTLGTHTYELWLWCEHTGEPHPVKRYEVPITAEWVRKIAPYAKLIATTLKAGLPVIGVGLGL